MPVSPRHLLIALVACALLLLTSRMSARLRPAFPSLPVQVEGHFLTGTGWYEGEPLRNSQPVQAWESWAGSDAHTGTLTLGPFTSQNP